MLNTEPKRMIVSFNLENTICTAQTFSTVDGAIRSFEDLYLTYTRRLPHRLNAGSYIERKSGYFKFYDRERLMYAAYFVNPEKVRMPKTMHVTKIDCIVALLYIQLFYGEAYNPFQAVKPKDRLNIKKLYLVYGARYLEFAITSALRNCHYRQLQNAIAS